MPFRAPTSRTTWGSWSLPSCTPRCAESIDSRWPRGLRKGSAGRGHVVRLEAQPMSPRRGRQGTAPFTRESAPRTLTDWAYHELKEAILQLRFRPGEPLRESVLAAMLGG